MKNLFAIVSFVFSTFAFGGVEGVYSIDTNLLREAIKSSSDYALVPESQQQMMLGMADQMKLSLTLETNGTFVALAEIMGDSQEGRGTYVQEATLLIMSTTSENGVTRTDPEEARFRVDGETLVIEEQGMPFPFVLRKAK